MTSAPLDGVRVLEFTHYVAGPYCGRLLADYGASVVKIEQPGGDPGRRLPPLVRLDSGDTESLLHLYLNHDKRTTTIDLKTNDGQKRALELARDADVIVENFSPGVIDGFGLGWETLQRTNPGLILTSISNFGQSGPYRDYRAWDIVVDALGGLSYIFGENEREPLTHPNPQAQYRAGACAAAATVAALLGREQTALGEWIDISIMECVAAALRDTIPQYTYMGAVRRRAANPAGGFGSVTACSDGYVIPTAYGAANWQTLTRFLEAPEMDSERFSAGDDRLQNAGELAEMLRIRLRQWQKFPFFHGSQEWGIGAGIVLTPAEVCAGEQTAARDFLQLLVTSEKRQALAPRRPFEI